MSRAKEKRERALGEHLHIKGERCSSPKCALVRRPYRPGVHGKKGSRKMLSEFGRQMREKQKFQVSYGIDERGLQNLFARALKKRGSTAIELVKLLERRLDNIVFRLGFAPSRAAARQLVLHGHITVNGRKTKSPGFAAKEGDHIAFREASQTKSSFRNLAETLQHHHAPEWLALDSEKREGEVKTLPHNVEMSFEPSLLVELFSK